MRFLAAAALALAMSFPAVAGPACQFVLPDVTAQLDAQGITYHVLNAEDRAKFMLMLPDDIAAKVTDVLVALIDGEVFFGLVIDGCLLPPQPMSLLTPVVGHLGGKTIFGVYA